jgi:hypothetical protein
MNRIPVRSTNIAEVGYDPLENRLEIRFRGGRTYEYLNVPLHVFEGLLHASSKGSYFYRRIRGRYPTRRVRPG